MSALFSKKSRSIRAAVKESLDNLPMGLCFVDGRGIILLLNRCMSTLAYAVTGAALQDPAAFWQTVVQGRLAVGAARIPYGTAPVIALSDGTTWAFSRRALTLEGREVTLLLASDITELDVTRSQLHGANARLKAMNLRLRQYSRDVTRVTAREERLATKVRIHDELGSVLLATRHYLGSDGGDEDAAPILERWQRNILLLRGSAAVPQQTTTDVLSNAAAALGVALRMHGPRPTEDWADALLLSAVSEALNNAVRHGGARTLDVVFAREPDGASVCIRNDGTPPEGPITEGGGLSALRRKAEARGGSLTLAAGPEFSLTLRIPLKEVTAP